MKTNDRNKFYIKEKLSKNISETPEGYLICRDAPIARDGELLYSSDELDIKTKSGFIRVLRSIDELSNEATIASFEGKPLTMYHPDDFVNAENWSELAIGITQNVRRGTGADSDKIIADIMVTNKDAIDKIKKGEIRELSNGYEAVYVKRGDGYVQKNIRGNHVALVDEGRCGSSCAIKDHRGVHPQEDPMAVKDKKFKKFSDEEKVTKEAIADEEKVTKEAIAEKECGNKEDVIADENEMVEDEGKEEQKDNGELSLDEKLDIANKKIADLEEKLAMKEKKSGDSKKHNDARKLFSDANIINPGIIKDSMEHVMVEKSLAEYARTFDGESKIQKLTGHNFNTLDEMTYNEKVLLLNSLAIMKQAEDAETMVPSADSFKMTYDGKSAMSAEDINEINRKFYKK